MHPILNGFVRISTRSRSFMVVTLVVVLAWTGRAFSDPIHSAAQKGDLAKVTALIKDNPSLVSTKDNMGMTPLHVAAKNDHKDVAEFLLANGADVNAKDSNGEFTPLDLALSCYHYMDVVELLLAKGADVNTRSKQGLTPLEEAAMRSQKDAAGLLLAKGADVNAKDSKGNTPLLWALLMGQPDMAKLLVDANADVNARNDQGTTPLWLAQQRSYDKIVDILRQHGAH
jgi:ankyrin repeat protein